jgi:hypothetical protein
MLEAMLPLMVLEAPSSNLLAAILGRVGLAGTRGIVLGQLAALGSGSTSGPYDHFNSNLLLLEERDIATWRAVVKKRIGRSRLSGRANQIDNLFQTLRQEIDGADFGYAGARQRSEENLAAHIRTTRRRASTSRLLGLGSRRDSLQTIGNAMEQALHVTGSARVAPRNARELAKTLWSNVELQSGLLDIVIEVFRLSPRLQWRESLRTISREALREEPARYLSNPEIHDSTDGSGSTRHDLHQSTVLLSAAWLASVGIPLSNPAAMASLADVALKSGKALPRIAVTILAAAEPGLVTLPWQSILPDILRSPTSHDVLRDSAVLRGPGKGGKRDPSRGVPSAV